MTTSETLTLAQQLINIESVTPNDNGCQQIIAQHLEQMGFTISHHPAQQVSNLWAERGDPTQPYVVFAGHTDVVPPGEIRQWATPPFQATIQDNKLYGRGAADMKGALAAMLTGCRRFVEKHPQHMGAIGFMITSDEEGEATHGTTRLVEHVINENKLINYCIVGEASSEHVLGDNIKIGRRGSLYGKLQVIGKQSHIAYPQKAINPIHRCFKALDDLTQIEWNDGNEHFSPTSFQIYNIHADTGATNMIPGLLRADFNLRYSPVSSVEALQQRIESALNHHDIEYTVAWNNTSQPFYSTPGALTQAATEAIQKQCQIAPQLNTYGGTSDGRFIAKTGSEIIELGPLNHCIHQVNEHVSIDDLNLLTHLYEDILYRLLVSKN